MLLAAVTFILWTVIEGWSVALFNSMAVLLVACPCALGLATPLAAWAAIARCGSRRMVVRGGDVVERLAAVDTVVFDKTGTLTGSTSGLVDFLVASPELDEPFVRAVVDRVESEVGHPLAAAFRGLGGSERESLEVEAVQLLVEHKADVNARTLDGVTPTAAAEAIHHPEMVKFLRSHGGKE